MAAQPLSSARSARRSSSLFIVGTDSRNTRSRDSASRLGDTAFRRALLVRAQPKPENSPAARVLDAAEFNLFVMRERDLADRGTRLFSLIVLRKRGAGTDGMEQLAQQLRERLRSTDLVGWLEKVHLGVLLCDTKPPGARAVGDWLSRKAVELGLDVDATIYVYPSVAEAGADGDDEDDDEHHHRATNGYTGGPQPRTTNGGSNGAASIGHRYDSTTGLRARGHRDVQRKLPMADLWPELSLSTPFWKRALDVSCALLGLLVLLPLLILIAVAIKLDSPGPVIFKQRRAGRGGRAFDFYKFRSMCVNAEQRRSELQARNEQTGPVFKIHNDPRITRVGRVLRRSSLDELPQLWNVIKGDISLVGPRSPTFDEVVRYERWHRRRLNITGGITCFWQVSGRSQIGFRDWMRMDRWYIKRRCLALDLWLLSRTLPAVVSGRGAC